MFGFQNHGSAHTCITVHSSGFENEISFFISILVSVQEKAGDFVSVLPS